LNNTGYIDYKNFCNYLYGREPLNPQNNSSKNEKDNSSIINGNINNNNNQINQKQKTPININQRQKTPLNNPNINITNNNNNINQNLPESQNSQNLKQIESEHNQQNLDPNQTKEYFKKLIISIKEQVHTGNGLMYYSLLFELKNSSDQNQNVSLENFVNAFKTIGLNIPENDIVNFFNLLDFSGTGKISIEDIINNIVDPMSEHRKLYVVNKFAKIDVEKQGEVKVSLLKANYNPKGHPDVISGKITDEEIFKQFCYTLDIYCNIRNINEIINYKQFIDYYNGISSSILDDKYFEDILNGVWDNESDINQNININNNLENNLNQNQIKENSNINNFNNNNVGNQNINNRRYNNEQNSRRNRNINMDNGFSDGNLGINGIFLGESTHVMPKSFAKRSLQNYRQQFKSNKNFFNNNNFNNQNQNNERINNTKSNDFVQNNQNNYNRNNFNQTPINQSQSIPMNQSNSNQFQSNNSFNNFMNNNNRQKKLKLGFNPITSEYKPLDNNMNQNNNNKTSLNQNNTNNEQSTSNSTMNSNQNNNPQNQSNEEQIREIIINSLNKFKNNFSINGSHCLFSFQRKLSLYDINHKGIISFDNFTNTAQAYTINISPEEIKIVFDLFDKEKNGTINYDELIQTIVGQISPQRQIIIQKVFERFNKDNNGKISVNEIKLLFNPRRHPDAISGKKSEGEIFGEFLDDVENYKEYLENLRGIYDGKFSFEDFINFYNEVGIGIEDDKIFEFMMNTCWNLDNNMGNMNINNIGGNRYKKYSGYDYNNNGNLMARAGSQIISNNKF
jgi:Ca2+-binding EF-hand superfamily protein